MECYYLVSKDVFWQPTNPDQQMHLDARVKVKHSVH